MSFRDVCLAILVAALWGFNFVVIKVGLAEFPPLFFAALRFILVAFPAVFFIKRNDIAWKWIIAIGLAIGVVKFSLLYIGMEIGMSAGLASLLLQIQVVFTVALAVIFLKEKLGIWQILGIILCIVGIVFIAFDKLYGTQFLAFILVMAAGLAWAIANLFIKKSGISDSFRLFVWMGLIPPIPLLVLSFGFESGQWEALQQMSWLGIGSVLYTSILSTIIGFGIWGSLINKLGPSKVVPFALLVPIFGLLSGYVVLGENFEANEIFGSIIVLIGLVFTILSSRLANFKSFKTSTIK